MLGYSAVFCDYDIYGPHCRGSSCLLLIALMAPPCHLKITQRNSFSPGDSNHCAYCTHLILANHTPVQSGLPYGTLPGLEATTSTVLYCTLQHPHQKYPNYYNSTNSTTEIMLVATQAIAKKGREGQPELELENMELV